MVLKMKVHGLFEVDIFWPETSDLKLKCNNRNKASNQRNEKSPKENSKSNKSPICHACGKPIRLVTFLTRIWCELSACDIRSPDRVTRTDVGQFFLRSFEVIWISGPDLSGPTH